MKIIYYLSDSDSPLDRFSQAFSFISNITSDDIYIIKVSIVESQTSLIKNSSITIHLQKSEITLID